jgi:catechol 2,3-dioxygenase-like lactoylglutathione lyase family enzyme
MLKGIHHTAISVPNLEEAIRFYQAIGGFTLVHQFTLENSTVNRAVMGVRDAAASVVLLKGATGYLELFQFDMPTTTTDDMPKVLDTGIRHICIQAQDGDQLFDTAEKLGAVSHARPTGLGTGNLYAYVRDPMGNVVELEGLPYAPAKKADSWFAHAAYVVRDINLMLPFYEALTGVECSRRGSFGPGMAFDTVSGLEGVQLEGAWIPVANGNLEFWRYISPVNDHRPAAKASDLGFTHVCFEVDNVEATVNKLKANGTRFLSDPLHTDTVTTIYGLDPEDNIFELIAFKDETSNNSLGALSGWGFLQDLAAATAAFYQQR